MVSRTAHYAISGVLRLAAMPAGVYCQVESLARGTGAPVHAAGKVLQTLARHGILESSRGTNGGFRLAPGAVDLSLMSLIEAVDGPFPAPDMLGRGLCLPKDGCPLAVLIQPLHDRLVKLLRTTTVRSLGRRGPSRCCSDPKCHTPLGSSRARGQRRFA